MSNRFRVYFVRHGETDWNRTRKLQGQLDVPLNETGLKQSILLGKALRDKPLVRAFSSDLQRAVQTAECILQFQPNIILEKDESIRERYYRDESQDIIPGSGDLTPSTETMPEFSARCLAWYTRSVKGYMMSTAREGVFTEQFRNILVVSHGGWILMLLTALKENGMMICRDNVEIGYCLNTGVSIVEYPDVPGEGRRFPVGALVQYSGVEHLTHENMTPLEVNKDVIGNAWWQP